MIRLRIVSDGTRTGTRIENAETGEVLDRVLSVTWEIDGNNQRDAQATLVVDRVLLDAEGWCFTVQGAAQTPAERQSEQERER